MDGDKDLPPHFRHDVYDVREILEEDVPQVHAKFCFGAGEEVDLLFDAESGLSIGVKDIERLHVEPQHLAELMRFLTAAEETCEE